MAENGHGRRIAISIGTNEYAKMDKLEFAESDAREMAKVLLNPDICGFDEVIELINKNKEEVSQSIEKVFKNAKKDDEVLIYYSGHGKLNNNFKLYLLFKDSDPESLLATSLKFDYINECKEQSVCNRVVVILDCCYSGNAGMRGDFLQEMLSTFSGSGTILLTSTGETGSNIAKEDKELKHGIFTNYLLKGLKDWAADNDDDGIITVDELYTYTFNETKDKSLQRPQKKGSYQGEMILGRNFPKIKRKELAEKKKRLVKYLNAAPPIVVDQSLTIFRKIYENQSALEPIEVDIKPHLEALLDGRIKVENYIEMVEIQEKLQKGKEQKQEAMQKGEKEYNLRNLEGEEQQKEGEKEIKSREKGKDIKVLKEQEKLRKDGEESERKEPEETSKVREPSPFRKKLRNISNRKVLTIGAIMGVLLILAILNPNPKSFNAPTIKEFSADIRSGPAPLTVQFTSNATGNPTNYFWVFEPSTRDDWNSKRNITARHTFHEPDIYTVSLTVENDAGNATLTIKNYINVTSKENTPAVPTTPTPTPSLKVPFVEDFSANVKNGLAPLKVQFTSNVTGNPTNYFWKFEPSTRDDWNSKHNITALHTFHEPDIYTVSLTVENESGNYTVTKKDYIKVTG